MNSELHDGIASGQTGAVLTVRLSAPERLNAVDAPMLDRLRLVLERADADPTIRIVVLTGQGRSFCSGAHLEPTGLDGQAPDTSTLAAANRVISTLTGLSTVVVCGLNGLAAGVGVSIALACDVIVAEEGAYFLLSFTKIGLMLDGGASALVAASLGRSKALQLTLLAEPYSAQEARAAGLVRSVHDAANFEAELAVVAARLAASPAAALASSKSAINAATLGELDAAIAREWDGQMSLLRGPDFAEGVRAFLSRRSPTSESRLPQARIGRRS